MLVKQISLLQECSEPSYVLCLVVQSCLTLCDPMDCDPMLLCPWGSSRQEYWSGLPFLSPGDFSNPGIKPRSPSLQADSLPSEAPSRNHVHCASARRGFDMQGFWKSSDLLIWDTSYLTSVFCGILFEQCSSKQTRHITLQNYMVTTEDSSRVRHLWIVFWIYCSINMWSWANCLIFCKSVSSHIKWIQ